MHCRCHKCNTKSLISYLIIQMPKLYYDFVNLNTITFKHKMKTKKFYLQYVATKFSL